MIIKNSSVSRVLSASAASWVRIGITIVAQVALVPIYLSSWDAATFGAWLLLQAVSGMLTAIDLAHHDYVGYECLRVDIKHRAKIKIIVFSAIPFALLIALADLVVVGWLAQAEFVSNWLGANEDLLGQWRFALILQALTWVFTGSQGGLFVRLLVPFGYNPTMAWWGAANALVTAAAPALAVLYGANLKFAAIALCVANIIYYILFFLVMTKFALDQKLNPTRPNLTEGAWRFLKSLWLTAKYVTEMVRQQGSRIILAPIAGAADMAAFATMRTGANFALQGLNTAAAPVMPELMRFLAIRDQHRMESAFAVVWLVLCAGLAPAILITQFLAPELFPLWTNNKIIFDPWLFGMLSLSVLILALAQPAAAILQGNNLVRTQLIISFFSAAIALGGMLLLVPNIGVRGAALALLLAEVLGLLANVWRAALSLQNCGLRWPWRPFAAVTASVFVSTGGLFALIVSPPARTAPVLAAALLLQIVLVVIYWRGLPPVAHMQVRRLFKPQKTCECVTQKNKANI